MSALVDRQVTLFEEFVLLKEFEKREDVLAAKVTSKQQEKLDMQTKVELILSNISVVFFCHLGSSWPPLKDPEC